MEIIENKHPRSWAVLLFGSTSKNKVSCLPQHAPMFLIGTFFGRGSRYNNHRRIPISGSWSGFFISGQNFLIILTFPSNLTVVCI
jgi:hypothetical protein